MKKIITNEPINSFSELLLSNIENENLAGIVASKPIVKQYDIRKLSLREIAGKSGEKKFLATLQYATKDITKTLLSEELPDFMTSQVYDVFANIELHTPSGAYLLVANNKNEYALLADKNKRVARPATEHNEPVNHVVPESKLFLRHLGISDSGGKIKNDGRKKFYQINKYVEIASKVVEDLKRDSVIRITDMGAGKGYLTFALYDYLISKGINVEMTGIEQRENLISECNRIADTLHFEHLRFKEGNIAEYKNEDIDVLIALHACDIATDMAIAYGIRNDASAIIVAPCCHKQVRREARPADVMAIIWKNGIMAERSAEIFTDTMRQLLLESRGYQTKIIEFISSEHTAKNTMIIATKNKVRAAAMAEFEALKKSIGLEKHYLENLI